MRRRNPSIPNLSLVSLPPAKSPLKCLWIAVAHELACTFQPERLRVMLAPDTLTSSPAVPLDHRFDPRINVDWFGEADSNGAIPERIMRPPAIPADPRRNEYPTRVRILQALLALTAALKIQPRMPLPYSAQVRGCTLRRTRNHHRDKIVPRCCNKHHRTPCA